MSGNERVAAASAALGLGVEVRAFPAGTKTAADAAAEVGCEVGQITPLRWFIDDALLAHFVVWAAAGTPTHVFAISPQRLADVADARVANLRA